MSLPAVLKETAGALTALTGWWKKSKGDVRALVGELKDNLSYLDMVAEDGVALGEVIDKISVVEYKRLAKEGFNFNLIKSTKIPAVLLPDGAELSSWGGKSTEVLIESIYDKIIELKIRYPHVQQSVHYRWHTRVNNIRKRVWLLFRHIASD